MKGTEIKGTDRLIEVFDKYPKVMKVYIEKGMHCVGCEILDFETVGESCENHDIDNKDEFIDYLNKVKDEPLDEEEKELIEDDNRE